MKIPAVLLAAAIALIPASAPTVSVAYAASLVAPMEGAIARALLARTGVRFAGEAKGSRALANLIRAGLRTPDVFISAEPKLLAGLAPSYTIFGSARMVIGYSAKSPHAALFSQAARGRISLLKALLSPGVRLGRTDPRLDPKGARTIRAAQLLGRHFHDAGAAQQLLRNSPQFPEEDLTVRVETGELDAGFFYSIETKPLGLSVIELPADANLANEIAFAVAILPKAAHPQAARTFVDFLLHGQGKTILEDAGLRYYARPRTVAGMTPG